MRILKSKITLIVVMAITGWLGLSFINIKIQENIVNKESKGLEVEISHLEDNNSYAKKLIEHFKHPSFLEREARLKLNYKKVGEEATFVYPDNVKIVSGSLDRIDQFKKEPSHVKWWRYLLNY